AARRIADKLEGIPQSSVMEALANVPSTAHILGGAVIGRDEDHGVVDRACRAYGYRNLLVVHGAAVPANPGVTPSLTITALAEHALSHVPAKEGAPSVPPVRLTPRPTEPQVTVTGAQAADPGRPGGPSGRVSSTA